MIYTFLFSKNQPKHLPEALLRMILKVRNMARNGCGSHPPLSPKNKWFGLRRREQNIRFTEGALRITFLYVGRDHLPYFVQGGLC